MDQKAKPQRLSTMLPDEAYLDDKDGLRECDDRRVGGEGVLVRLRRGDNIPWERAPREFDGELRFEKHIIQ